MPCPTCQSAVSYCKHTFQWILEQGLKRFYELSRNVTSCMPAMRGSHELTTAPAC